MKKLSIAVLILFAVIGRVNAALITITFDDAIADYNPTPGAIQHVTDEFSSLGLIFKDVVNPSFGATLGKCGPGQGPVALFGYGVNGSCGDYTPNLDILFVDPLNSSQAAYTTSFSVYNYDGMVKLTAFDVNDVELGSTQNFSGQLSLSGLGQISKVNLLSLDQDPTTLDTIIFESVTSHKSSSVPVPEPQSLSMFALALVSLLATRRMKKS